jgi:hypothetical protein
VVDGRAADGEALGDLVDRELLLGAELAGLLAQVRGISHEHMFA